MYTKVLVPLDGSKLSEQILPYARLIAEAFQIPVGLLHVNDPAAMTPFAPPLQGGDYLKRIAESRLGPGAQATLSVEGGKPDEIIVGAAAADPGTLIAMATHGMAGIQRWFLGGTAYKVTRAAKNPLLLIRPVEDRDPGKAVQLKTLIVPLDGSGLADRVLPHVLALARRLALEVTLVRAYAIPPESYVVGDGLYVDQVRRGRDALHSEVEQYLSGKSEELHFEGVARVSGLALEGDAADQIVDLALKTPDNLIAMSTHGRSGVGRFVLGSVAEKVIQHSRDPVLIIRPA